MNKGDTVEKPFGQDSMNAVMCDLLLEVDGAAGSDVNDPVPQQHTENGSSAQARMMTGTENQKIN